MSMRHVGDFAPTRGPRRRIHAEGGATTVEYSLMMVLVLLVAFAAVQAFGISVAGLFQSLVDLL